MPRPARGDGPIRVGSAVIGSFGPGVDSTSQSSRESSGLRMWGKAWPYLRLPRGGHPCGQHTYPSRRLVCMTVAPTAAELNSGGHLATRCVVHHAAVLYDQPHPRSIVKQTDVRERVSLDRNEVG